MNKKLAGLTLLLLTMLPVSGALADDQVAVTIPGFDAALNGQTTSNTYSRYPLLVYHDITYFPMTYDDSRLLGLKSEWDSQTGLNITKGDNYCYEYSRAINEQPNKSRLTAQIATGKITVNGQAIDNKVEPYPLLVFRNVTYFPLTWRFAVDAFGWKYDFNQQHGLAISNHAVKQEDPEPWQGSTAYFNSGGAGSMAGADDLRFPIRAVSSKHTLTLDQVKGIDNIGKTTNPNDFGLALYNYNSVENITVEPMAQWEYRLYRLINGHQELLYWRKIPFYSGYLAARNVAISPYYTIPFWQSDELKMGTYNIQIVHPDKIIYKLEGSDVLQHAAIEEAPEDYRQEGSAVNLFFSGTIVIKK